MKMSAADLSRVLGSDRSLGPKLLRGERRLTADHIRTLARHFQRRAGSSALIAAGKAVGRQDQQDIAR